ncbi:hypothetical protein JCM10908_002893 [Rhodotorula pacifica]|uniref:uncharacterized protein n=1 Tax=Rhodotorula pacifica TaxID=1495444 RepID=UPI00316E66C7
MLSQNDVIRLLLKPDPLPQVVVFSILHAYVYSKSRRGNLPSETLSKLLAIQRKLQAKMGHVLDPGSPLGAALDAMKVQLMAVNRKWFAMGPLAFGPLGALGATGGNVDAQWAWERATDGKVKDFPKGDGGGAMGWMPGNELDAGRVVAPRFGRSGAADDDGGTTTPDLLNAPPEYDGPPPPDTEVVQALEERQREDAEGVVHNPGRDSVDTQRLELSRTRSTSITGAAGAGAGASSVSKDPIGEGAAHLARLRQLKEDREREEAAVTEEEGSSSSSAKR